MCMHSLGFLVDFQALGMVDENQSIPIQDQNSWAHSRYQCFRMRMKQPDNSRWLPSPVCLFLGKGNREFQIKFINLKFQYM